MSTTASRHFKAVGQSKEYIIANAVNIAIGDYAAIDTATGHLTEIADTAGFVPAGLVTEITPKDQPDGWVTGAVPPAAGTRSPTATVDLAGDPTILKRVPVTGAAAQSDVGDEVYITGPSVATDLTLTPTANIGAIGRIVGFASATEFDVLLYPASQLS